MSDRPDVVVVGGGIVGLATACSLLRRAPGLRLIVLEKEREVGSHQTGHNSGVLHSGLYYAPGSLKARLCREGKAATERFADEHGIAHERTGKLVVAVDDAELPRLADLRDRGLANGVEGIEEIGPERIRELEPHVTGLRALWVPETGIIDFRRVALALVDEIAAMGGRVLTDRPVTDIGRLPERRWLVVTPDEAFLPRHLITCAGLQSDRIAALTGHAGDERIVPFRGDYQHLRPEARHFVRGLVYPVPDPTFPFLGVHFTRRIDGEVWAGPNAVPAFAREGYGRTDVSLRDLGASVAWPGLWRLARPYLRTGIAEAWRDVSARAFLARLRRYVPELGPEDLAWGPSGVRAQSLGRDGRLVDDFSLGIGDGVIHVRNAPSPAATASLAIGRILTERAIEAFGLDARGQAGPRP